MIPPFPFTNLSLTHLIPLFTDPEDAGSNQPFHLVMPSLPGLGFSDALPNNTPMIKASAEIFDCLMSRLGYRHYIATNPGPSTNSPSQVDWKLANYLALNFQDSCLGFHFISPPLEAPTIRGSPLEWAKWRVVDTFKSPGLGYSREDLSALKRASGFKKDRLSHDPRPEEFAFDGNGFREPNTLSYALCDSPIGLLLFVLMILRVLGPDKELTPQELITLTELTWLPGPEATMRLWAHCASLPTQEEKPSSRKPRIGITTFTGEGGNGKQGDPSTSPRPAAHFYACPSWGKARYNIVSTQRVVGKPGLLAWEKPEVIVNGTRSLAKQILAEDKRIQTTEPPGAVLREQVVIGGDEQAPAETSGTTVGEMVDSPSEGVSRPKLAAEQILQVPGKDPGSKRESTAARPLLMEESPGGRMSEDPEEIDDSSPDTVVAIGAKDTPDPIREDAGGRLNRDYFGR